MIFIESAESSSCSDSSKVALKKSDSFVELMTSHNLLILPLRLEMSEIKVHIRSLQNAQ